MLVLNSCLLCKVIHEYIGRDVQERNSVNMKAPAVLMLYIYIIVAMYFTYFEGLSGYRITPRVRVCI